MEAVTETNRFGQFGFELDPEMKALLREIASNERARLLRVPRGRAMACLFERSPRVGLFAPGLTSAEVKLLERHREELAHLLLRVYYERYLQNADVRRRHCLHGPEKYKFLGEVQLERRVLSQVNALRSAYPTDSVAIELIRLTEGATTSGVSRSQILAAARGLAESDLTRIYTGYELALAESPEAAAKVFYDVGRQTLSRQTTLLALSALGDTQARMGQMVKARETFAQSAQMGLDFLNEPLSWLAYALQTGHLDQVRAASDLVDSSLTKFSDEVAGWVRSRHEERDFGIWSPSIEGIRLARSQDDRVGPVAQMVFLNFTKAG